MSRKTATPDTGLSSNAIRGVALHASSVNHAPRTRKCTGGSFRKSLLPCPFQTASPPKAERLTSKTTFGAVNTLPRTFWTHALVDPGAYGPCISSCFTGRCEPAFETDRFGRIGRGWSNRSLPSLTRVVPSLTLYFRRLNPSYKTTFTARTGGFRERVRAPYGKDAAYCGFGHRGYRLCFL